MDFKRHGSSHSEYNEEGSDDVEDLKTQLNEKTSELEKKTAEVVELKKKIEDLQKEVVTDLTADNTAEAVKKAVDALKINHYQWAVDMLRRLRSQKLEEVMTAITAQYRQSSNDLKAAQLTAPNDPAAARKRKRAQEKEEARKALKKLEEERKKAQAVLENSEHSDDDVPKEDAAKDTDTDDLMSVGGISSGNSAN